MNIAEQTSRFTPDIRISREQFTPELQESLIRRSMGIAVSQPEQNQVGDDRVVLNKAEFEKMRESLNHYTTVFNAPGVADRIGEIILGAPRAAAPVSQPAQNVVTVTSNTSVNAGLDGSTGQAVSNNGQVNEPAASDFWSGILGTGNSDSASNTGATGAPIQTANPQAAPVENTGQSTMATAQVQAPGNETMEFVNQISAHAMSANVNPKEVVEFFATLDPQSAVNLYAAIKKSQTNTGQPSRPAGVNLATERAPAGPIKIDRSFSVANGGPSDRNAYRV